MSVEKSHYIYTPYFCEENIWHLANSLVNEGINEKALSVLFLSNQARQIVLYQQRNALSSQAIIWDYHVILQQTITPCQHDDTESLIYDFDTILPFPVKKTVYFDLSFPSPERLLPQFHMLIRTIPAVEYLAYFSSDRSHMKGLLAEDHFPNYPCIKAGSREKSITLQEYLNMNKQLPDNSYVQAYHKYKDQGHP